MSVEELKALARREIDEIFSRGRLDVADQIIAQDYVGHDPALPEPTRGADGLKEVAARYRAAFPDLQCIPDQQLAEGEWVVTRWTARGTHLGDFFGVPPTGKEATVTGISLSRVIDGKIVEDWTNWDAFGLMQQLGAVSVPAGAQA